MNPVKEILLLYLRAGFQMRRYYRSASEFLEELMQFSRASEAKQQKRSGGVALNKGKKGGVAKDEKSRARRAERRSARLDKMKRARDTSQLVAVSTARDTASPPESGTVHGTSGAAGSIDVLNGEDMARLEAELQDLCAETPLALPRPTKSFSPCDSPCPQVQRPMRTFGTTPATTVKKSESLPGVSGVPLFAYLKKDGGFFDQENSGSDQAKEDEDFTATPAPSLVGDFSDQLWQIPQYRCTAASSSCTRLSLSPSVDEVATQKRVLMARSTNLQEAKTVNVPTEAENIAVALIERFGRI